jgi:hypothetical protein
MANIYYSHSANRQGTLRAVLSSDEGKFLLNGHSAQYTGPQFPTMGQNMGVDFAVLRVFEGEMSQQWRAGFYRFDEEIIRIEEAVRACDAKLVYVDTKHPHIPRHCLL